MLDGDADPGTDLGAKSIGQSRRYLAAHFPSAGIQEVNSTALASQYASKNRESAAVCSVMCAELYGLEVVDTDIQDGERMLICAVCKRWLIDPC